MLSRSFFPNFDQGAFPKIAGKSPEVCRIIWGWRGEGVQNTYSVCAVLINDDPGREAFIPCMNLQRPLPSV